MAAVAVMSVGSSKTIIMKKDQFMKKYTRTIAPRRSSGSSGSSGSLDELVMMMRITLFLNEGVNIHTLCSKQIDRDWVIDTLVDDSAFACCNYY